MSLAIDPNPSALKPRLGIYRKPVWRCSLVEAVMAAAPAAEDPSPEVMVVVNDCHVQHSSLNIPQTQEPKYRW